MFNRKRMQETINNLRLEVATKREVIFRNHNTYAHRYIELVRLNDAMNKRSRAYKRLRDRNLNLRQAAINLRLAQREYIAAKGNPNFGVLQLEQLGQRVALAATQLDLLLPPYTEADKAASARNRRPMKVISAIGETVQ